MNILMHILSLLFFCGVFALIVRYLRKMVPGGYFNAVWWGIRTKKFWLALLSPLLIAFAGLLVFSSFNFHYMLLFGNAKGATIVGETLDCIRYVGINDDKEKVQQYEPMVQSVENEYNYPGKTFQEAIRDIVFITYPGYDEQYVLLTNAGIYIFVNLVVVFFLCVAFLAGFFLKMYYAVHTGSMEKVLSLKEISPFLKKRLKTRWQVVLAIITSFFILSGCAAWALSQKYTDIIDASRSTADMVRSKVLSQTPPGAVLKGIVVNRERFAVSKERRNFHSDGHRKPSDRRTITHRFTAYLVRFDALYEHPVFVSMIVKDTDVFPEGVQKTVDRLESSLSASVPETFLVQDNCSIELNPVNPGEKIDN